MKMAEAVKQYKSKKDKDGTDKSMSYSERTDETDLAASRQSFYGSENIGRKSTVCDALFAFGSMGTFVADIASDLVVSYQYYDHGEYWWFGLTLAFVLLASVTMQIFSAKWFHEDGKNRHWIYNLLHFLHLGPLVRYWRAFREGWKTRTQDSEPNQYDIFLAEWRDISMLRLFEAFLESAPQLVLQLYIMSYRRRFHLESDLFTAVAAVCSLVSLAWAIVSYSKALRDLQSDKGSLSWIGFGFQIVWRLCMVASRVVALVVFASVYSYYLFVAIGVHWALMTMWLVCQKTKFCTDEDGEHPLKEKLFNMVIGFIYIFCFFNTKEGMTRKRLFFYYSIMLVENSLFVSMWYPQRALFGGVALAAIIIVWGGFVIGIVSMIMYYKFYHPSLPGTGIFFQRVEFDVEGHRVYSVVCCCCCRIQSSDTTEATCGSVVRWCPRPNDPALVAQPQTPRRSPRNRPPTPRHEPEPSYPPFELEVLPRQISREFPRQKSPQTNRCRHAQRDGVHSPGYSLRTIAKNSPHPEIIPAIVVTSATPDILSPRDSISTPAVCSHHRCDNESSSDDEAAPMLVGGSQDVTSGTTVDFPDGIWGSPMIEKHDTEPLSPTEVHDAINRILHHERNNEEGTVEDDGEDIRPINYGTLSFGNRYSIVSDCISLSSDSRSSDSLNEESAGEDAVSADTVVPRPSDEGIYSDNYDSPVKKGPGVVQPVLDNTSSDDPIFSVKDVKQRARKRAGSLDSGDVATPLAASLEAEPCVVEFIMDAPPSPKGTLIHRKELSTRRYIVTEVSSERDEGLEMETESPEGSTTGSPAGSTSGSTGNHVRQVTEVMSEEESSLPSPFSEESRPKRHTFDFSELSKARPFKKSERRRRRPKRKEFDNFVITSIKPCKFGSIRRSSERLSKIQEASEETIGLTSNSSIKEYKEISRDTGPELSAGSDHGNETEDPDGTNSETQSPLYDVRKVREEYVKRRRLKRLLTRQLSPGKFSTVRRSYETILNLNDEDLLQDKELEKSKINCINKDKRPSPVERRHTYDFSSISVQSPNLGSDSTDDINDLTCFVSPSSPVWKYNSSSVDYRKRRPKSDIYTRRNLQEITA